MSTLKVDTIQHSGGTSGLTIDSSGRVSRNLIPSWRVGLDNDQNETTALGHTVEFDNSSTENCFIAGGCTLSAGVITVPVAGLYSIASSVRFDNVTGTDYIILRTVKNGSTSGLEDAYAIVDDHGTSYHSITVTDLLQCNAGDTLEISGYVSNDTSWHFAANTCHFNGYMVG